MSGRPLMPARRGLLAGAASGLALAGCSSLSWLGLSEPKIPKLTPLSPKLALLTAWSARVPVPPAGLTPTLLKDQLVLAGRDGQLLGLGLARGEALWSLDLRQPLAAGVGSDGRFHAVVLDSSELLVVEGGRERWRHRLGVRVVTAPLVAGERVFVLTVDRQVLAFDALDGRLIWSQQRAGAGEPLTLLQPGVLRAHRNTVLAGLGPRLVALDALDGSVRWDLPLATPRGTNEVERLADLVGPSGRDGAVVCARAFQAALGCVEADRGQLQWSKPGSGEVGLALDAERVYAADSADRLSAFRRGGGELVWTQELLARRRLAAPVVVGPHLVVADVEGWVHYFDARNGAPLARLATDGGEVDAPLLVQGSTVLVLTRRGGLHAVRAA